MLSAPQPFVLFPGSFNPMHEGHVLLARVAEELRQQPLAFEISVTNVDKPPLAGETVQTPARAIRLEVAGRTHESADLPRKVALVSEARRLWSARIRRSGWLRRNIMAMTKLRMHVALEEIASSGSSFLVAVRIDAAGRVRALNDIPVPRRYADLFTEIPEHVFRVDTSSSEIRARRRPVLVIHDAQLVIHSAARFASRGRSYSVCTVTSRRRLSDWAGGATAQPAIPSPFFTSFSFPNEAAGLVSRRSIQH